MKPIHFLCVAWLTALLSGMSLDRWHEKQFLPPPENRKANDVLIDVVGEFKTVLARYLWFRMDLFHEVLDEQGVPTEQQTEVLPLLRMVSLLDPSMTDSYDQIVWDLYKGQGDLEMALLVLEEGLERNPQSYELHFRRALLAYMEKDFDKAHEYAVMTLPLTQDEVRQADCLRIIYWSAVKQGKTEIQRMALSDLLKLRPNDPLWVREAQKLNQK